MSRDAWFDELDALCREAFMRFQNTALQGLDFVATPGSIEGARIVSLLRRHGTMESRELANHIEHALNMLGY